MPSVYETSVAQARRSLAGLRAITDRLTAPTGRRASHPTGPHAEAFRARLRLEAGRTPTHRKEEQ